MGEVINTPTTGGINYAQYLRYTLENPNIVAQEASATRTDLLLQNNFDISALAIDMADTIKADNSAEKALAHQMAMTHELVMRLGNAAMGEVYRVQKTGFHDPLEQGAATELQRLVNCVSRLQATYQQGLLTIQKLRTGGNQTVTVQHVNIESGGQAVIGNVGGRKPEGVRCEK